MVTNASATGRYSSGRTDRTLGGVLSVLGDEHERRRARFLHVELDPAQAVARFSASVEPGASNGALTVAD
jgi:hypothetical protein